MAKKVPVFTKEDLSKSKHMWTFAILYVIIVHLASLWVGSWDLYTRVTLLETFFIPTLVVFLVALSAMIINDIRLYHHIRHHHKDLAEEMRGATAYDHYKYFAHMFFHRTKCQELELMKRFFRVTLSIFLLALAGMWVFWGKAIFSALTALPT